MAAEGVNAICEAAKTGSPGRVCVPPAFVDNAHQNVLIVNTDGDPCLLRGGVLGDVGKCLRTHEVHSRFDSRRQTSNTDSQFDWDWSPIGQRRQRSDKPALSKRRWPDALRQFAQFGACAAQFLSGRAKLSGRSADRGLTGDVERPRHRVQTPTRPFRQLTLEPPTLRVRSLDDAPPRGGQFEETLLHLGL
jgi:hypothetical protein